MSASAEAQRGPMPSAEEQGRPGFTWEDWWKKNGDRVNEKRRNRYKTDPEYREAQKALSRKNYAAQAKQRDEAGGIVTKVRRFRKAKKIMLNGNVVELFSVGTFAKAIGRMNQTISVWERQGFLPKTPFRTPKDSENGVRLYSRDMIDVVRRVLEEAGHVRREESDTMRERFAAGWRELGVTEDMDYEFLDTED